MSLKNLISKSIPKANPNVVLPRKASPVMKSKLFQAADNLIKAAEVISKNPQALQLRFLGTLTEIATERNSTIVFPIPIDLLKAFTEKK